jgi:GNAT superfamily N-acetyltransferase
MITFEKISETTLYIAEEIVNSNPNYNRLENGSETRSIEDLRLELLASDTISVFVKLDDTYIGVVNYLMENHIDHCLWIRLLMIHQDYQGYGFGTQAYFSYEKDMLEKGTKVLRLGVPKGNEGVRKFWEELGFVYYETKKEKTSGAIVDCFEKGF